MCIAPTEEPTPRGASSEGTTVCIPGPTRWKIESPGRLVRAGVCLLAHRSRIPFYHPVGRARGRVLHGWAQPRADSLTDTPVRLIHGVCEPLPFSVRPDQEGESLRNVLKRPEDSRVGGAICSENGLWCFHSFPEVVP